MSNLVVVAGAGGFIGGHLVARLVREGRSVRAVDIKPGDQWWQKHDVENFTLDLRDAAACRRACRGAVEVYNLAADMGGMGFIENNKALCMLSVLINTHMLQAALGAGVFKYFFSSSACVYNTSKQQTSTNPGLQESDAYPAMAEIGYGEEKLFSERMCQLFREDFGLHTRVARFHNVYGPRETWRGGREKAPAAICRKVAEAVRSGIKQINIWGSGAQTRSFMWIDDCIEGTRRLMDSDVTEPLNVGSDEMVSINQLVDMVEAIAGVKLERIYDLHAPKGVQGRNSDNSLIKQRLGWAPATPLYDGLQRLYAWVYDQVVNERHHPLAG